MAHGNTIYHQMLKLIPRDHFGKLETEPGTGLKARVKSPQHYCVINSLQKLSNFAYAGCMTNAPFPNIEAWFRAYAEKLSTALSHADRVEPFQAYCTGLAVPMGHDSAANWG
jgi:hypothetical protein